MSKGIKSQFSPTYDAGSAFHNFRGVSGAQVTSATPATPFAVTGAPPSQHAIAVLDLIVSADAAMRVDFYEEDTPGTIFLSVYVAAADTKQITTRGDWFLPTAGKRLYAVGSAAGNVYVAATYYYRPKRIN